MKFEMKKQTIDVTVAFGICIYIIDIIWNFSEIRRKG